MKNELTWIIAITASEYNGNSFNGPNLVKTLRHLSYEQVITNDTFEGYNVWGIVLHLMKWKHTMAKLLGDDNLSSFAYPGDNFPDLPDDLSPMKWDDTLAEMDVIHAAYIQALTAFDPDKLDEKMEWGCTYGEAVAWMTTHDTYHIAQIRNMGLVINFK